MGDKMRDDDELSGIERHSLPYTQTFNQTLVSRSVRLQFHCLAALACPQSDFPLRCEVVCTSTAISYLSEHKPLPSQCSTFDQHSRTTIIFTGDICLSQSLSNFSTSIRKSLENTALSNRAFACCDPLSDNEAPNASLLPVYPGRVDCYYQD
jgi:hypothetical protein